MHCDPCHCIYSWQALVTLQGILGVPLAVSLPATPFISRLQCLESVHGASFRYANRRESCGVFPSFCQRLSAARASWDMRCVRTPFNTCWLLAKSPQDAALPYRTGNRDIAGHQRDLGRCHISRVCSLY